MRYYSITIRDKTTDEVIRPKSFASLNLPDTYTSYVKNKTLPGALDIELNIPAANYAAPLGGAWLRIWGISLAEIYQGQDLAECPIIIKAGFKKGLPLAKPEQSGVIVEGTILKAFGNWIGTDMSLDMILTPPTGSGRKPLNFAFEWRKNTPMADMIRTVLLAALPAKKARIEISDKLVMNSTQYGAYTSLEDFSKAILALSMSQQFRGIEPKGGGSYSGVQISVNNDNILVYDNTLDHSKYTYDDPKRIAFEDLIGQPTWINPGQINFKCAMRADMTVGDIIRMPDKMTTPYVLTTQQASIPGTNSQAPSKNKAAFQGRFLINSMQHFGRYRQATAEAWVTSFVAAFLPDKKS